MRPTKLRNKATAPARPPYSALLLMSLSLAGCAATNGADRVTTPIAEPTATATEPAWRIGFTWPVIDPDRLRRATRQTLDECVIGKTNGLEAARIVETETGFEAIDAPSGERRLWMALSTPPADPAAQTLNLNWVDGVGPAARVAFLQMVDRAVKSLPPC